MVVAEQGFAAAQVAVVASVAGVATGSVYRHFPSKSSLFAEMLRSVVWAPATLAALGTRTGFCRSFARTTVWATGSTWSTSIPPTMS